MVVCLNYFFMSVTKQADNSTVATETPTSPSRAEADDSTQRSTHHKLHKVHSRESDATHQHLMPPTTIRITPPTPLDAEGNPMDDALEEEASMSVGSIQTSEPSLERTDARVSEVSRPHPQRQGSKDSGHKAKKVQELLRSRVHKGAEGIKTVSKKISKGGVGKRSNGNVISLHRSNSAPGE